jgi:peptidoglycan-associated lipoprotein
MKTSFVVFTIVSALTGCATTEASPARLPAATPSERPASNQAEPSRSMINVADEIRSACGISTDDAYFAFDSSSVQHSDYPTLDKLVSCFSTGRLAHRQMRLVGHTDPRGAEEYNLALAGSRADGVRGFLVGRGLAGAQVASTSRGELDAKGTNEGTWAEDRRVDVQLAN